jgi:hypothetical protein
VGVSSGPVKSIDLDGPLCCGKNKSSGFVVSCGEFKVCSGFVGFIGGDLWQLEDEEAKNRLVKLW